MRDACDGFIARAAIAASLTADERREILRGMILTRAIDNRLKQFFSSSDVRYKNTPFLEGIPLRSARKRSTPPASVYGAAPPGATPPAAGRVTSSVRSFAIGVSLAMRSDDEAIRSVLNAQMGKAGPPMDGKDLHIGDFDWGVLPATAPLSISTMSIAGIAMAFALQKSNRVAVSFIGEGGSSLGEWHEAINLCAARRLPAFFCLENNQTALSTPVPEQSAVCLLTKRSATASRASPSTAQIPTPLPPHSPGLPSRARATGPTLIELVTMRMSGHAHHDDMLYLGKEPPIGGATRSCRPVLTPMPRDMRSGRRRIPLQRTRHSSKLTG